MGGLSTCVTDSLLEAETGCAFSSTSPCGVGCGSRSLQFSAYSGEDPSCQSSDLELNGLVVPAGETASVDGEDDRQRIYTEITLETFYFNNTADGD